MNNEAVISAGHAVVFRPNPYILVPFRLARPLDFKVDGALDDSLGECLDIRSWV